MQTEENKTDPWCSKPKENSENLDKSLKVEQEVYQKTIGDFFGGGVRWLLVFLYAVLASGTFILFIYSTIEAIFEHGEGWHDLDTLEIVFLVSMLLVVKRFFVKANYCGFSWWNSIIRIVHYSVIFSFITMTPLYLNVIDPALLVEFSAYIDEYDLITNLGFILTIFAMTPIPGKDDMKIKLIEGETSGETGRNKINEEII